MVLGIIKSFIYLIISVFNFLIVIIYYRTSDTSSIVRRFVRYLLSLSMFFLVSALHTFSVRLSPSVHNTFLIARLIFGVDVLMSLIAFWRVITKD